ncbi:MAG: hypothetical protein KAT79_01890 [candidate division Zixibacteria bacterium]|nr:hypothetical protein [candidate division Zixibacteria bacterium]
MARLIQNPGSALGEAIGANMEAALNLCLDEVAGDNECHFICKGPKNRKTGKHKKLLLYDEFATAYNIDSVIANDSIQPLILFECKYIRYKKHNRDKGSWVCHTHSALRKRYAFIRSSIAVLAGNWSESSQLMMTSHRINLFLISFDNLCELLSGHNIDFRWGEKERKKATRAWTQYNRLSQTTKLDIGLQMIQSVKEPLTNLIEGILNPQEPRELDHVTIELLTSQGETLRYSFEDIDGAMDLLRSLDVEVMFEDYEKIRLTDPPPMLDT